MGGESIWLWIGFNVFVLALLALDLGVFHRHAHAVTVKEATIWSVVWIALSLLFSGAIYLYWDVLVPESAYTNSEATLAYLAGYLIEKSLSVDNIFVFALLFSYFAVPAVYQHRVLFWGILGALLMRGALIAVGAALIHQFHWIIYIFGGFLILTGIRMATHNDEEVHPEKNPLLRLFRRIIPVTESYVADKFFVRQKGILMATPLFLVLIIVESTDLVFAVDSIPAIFAVTTDPFIVYTSNVFAILGLRSLYFMLAGAMGQFYYLKPALSIVLVFVGVKMVIVDFYKIPVAVSLGVIASILTVAVIASLWRNRRIAAQESAAQESAAQESVIVDHTSGAD
jgi:tellurite resistance protein TerC